MARGCLGAQLRSSRDLAQRRFGSSDHLAVAFTSWTTDKGTAKIHAQDGVVLEADIPVSRTVKSPDIYKESEVLVTGDVTGATVH